MLEDRYQPNIVIERETKVSDGLGGYKKTWDTHLTISAAILNISASID